jgi:hypothetical protein
MDNLCPRMLQDPQINVNFRGYKNVIDPKMSDFILKYLS